MTGSARAAGVEEERFNMRSGSSSQRNLIQGEWGYYDDDDDYVDNEFGLILNEDDDYII